MENLNMEKLNMEYNSQRELLVISEYGRNIQNLINHTKSIEDKEKRQAFAENVVELMQQMNPQNKNVLEYKEKLWHHFFDIANYEIDVVPPSGKVPVKEDIKMNRQPIEYHEKLRDHRHYGLNVRHLIQKAIEMEDGPKKDGFIEVIAAFMKLAYRNWNKEHYVNDEIIIEDLKHLSENKLKIPDNISFDLLTSSTKPKKRSSFGGSHKSKNKGRRRR